MPADRRSISTSIKPVKTERTHEENQERAYIAASRRSDRSLEARIESARRASEIHKKRTGRGLRVTEQDVVNEEMYEEEDDDLPTQYQRLSAHLHTGSLQFNRKLHDYIATQHGVRNAFLQQYANAPLPNYGSRGSPYAQMQNPYMLGSFMGPQQMLPPHVFNQPAQAFNQPAQPMSPHVFQNAHQGYRQAPYAIPPRSQVHQRSASIPTLQQMPGSKPAEQHFAPAGTTLADEQRRLSLPPQALEQSLYQPTDDQSRPSLSHASASQSVQCLPASPSDGPTRSSATPPSAHGTPASTSHQANSPTSPLPFMTMNYSQSSQVLNMNPLSMSLPPESQQFMGSVLDPNDPLTSIFMAGSEFLPQPFGKYTYNPNINSKLSCSDDISASIDTTIPTITPIKVEATMESTSSPHPKSASSEGIMSSTMFSSTSYEFPDLFDGAGYTPGNEELDDNAFTNAFLNSDAWD